MSKASGHSTALELELSSDPGLLPGLRRRLRNWALRHGWGAEQAADIALAVDEALSNVIRHGYGSERGHKIELCVRAIKEPEHGEGLEIWVRDFGKQCDPATIHGRPLDEVRPGGLGVHIIRAMMSTVEYRRAAGGGMLLIMRKYKGSRPAKSQAARHERPSRRPKD